MQAVVTPGKSRLTQQRSDEDTNEHTQQRRKHTPPSYHLHKVFKSRLVTLIEKCRDMTHCTEGNAKISGLRYEIHCCIEERSQSHT